MNRRPLTHDEVLILWHSTERVLDECTADSKHRYTWEEQGIPIRFYERGGASSTWSLAGKGWSARMLGQKYGSVRYTDEKDFEQYLLILKIML